MKSIGIILGLYLLAAPFGYLLNHAGVPLAWMIGPLLVIAALVSTGIVKQTVPTGTRPIGQIVVATFVGAHFSPEAFHALRHTAPLVIGLSLFTLAGSLLVARLQMKLFQTDPVTAILSVVPTSPVEAGVLAEANNVSPTPIIFSQTVRIAMVVLLVPFLMYATAGGGLHPPIVPSPDTTAQGNMWLMVAGAIAGVTLFKTLRLTNPFFLGPLFASSVLAALGLQTYHIPTEILYGAQLILGTWLGSCFRPELWRSGGRVFAPVALSSTLLLTVCCLGAFLASLLFNVPLPTLVLGAAPGGVTEMALTAGTLGLDVALVTVFHLARIFIIMPSLGRIVRAQQPNPSV